MKNKILIIRLSSFGDIVQCMSILDSITGDPLNAEVHWLARSDLSSILSLSTNISKVWSFDRKDGLLGLIFLGLKLRSVGFTHIYDAHCSLRSKVLKFILRPFGIGPKLTQRSKERLKRILLFSFKVNKFPAPFKGMLSYNGPLEVWNIKNRESFNDKWTFKETLAYEGIALAPSAAWEMKRWPLKHWKKLIELMPDQKFIILGGAGDSFCQELETLAPMRVQNLAGKLSLTESCQLVVKAPLLISADTGLIHVADLLGSQGISLIGPTAFGFPTNKNITTLEVELDCRPCTKDGRGSCSQETYQRCMVEITPESVAKEAYKKLSK